MLPEFDFICRNCNALVITKVGSRNNCTKCEWSVHNTYGTFRYPPCGADMKPEIHGLRVTHTCLGCEYIITGPTEATVDRQLAGERMPMGMRSPMGAIVVTTID